MMRNELNRIDMQGSSIGEGEMDEAPMLYWRKGGNQKRSEL